MGSAKLYYDGREFLLADGDKGAEVVLREAKSLIAQGGGILEVNLSSGVLSIVVDRGIPLAVMRIPDRDTSGVTFV